jgi:ribosomal protein S18 acetylase RimI-like enzyme
MPERRERVVQLGVDAENPSGATRLYERVGMTVGFEAVIYAKDLP